MALVIDLGWAFSCVYGVADKVKENRFGLKNKINHK
jgi:hypothetical protein